MGRRYAQSKPIQDGCRRCPPRLENKDFRRKALTYFPVVDTGWDSRPWHGDKAMAIEGRTPELFGRLLKAARKFVQENNLPLVILGPVSEWGEGSYIEPCVEYGFTMYDAVRETFCLRSPPDGSVTSGRPDIGCGPYEFPACR